MAYVVDEIFKLKYSIKKVIKELDNNDYFLRIKFKSVKGYNHDVLPTEINAYGNFLNACEGDIYESDAVFKETKTGYYIKLLGVASLVAPSNKKELSKYISKHVIGISRDTIDRLIDGIGLDIISKINDDPSILNGYNGFSEGSKKYKALVDWCEYNSYFEELLLFIENLSLPAKLATKIYSKYGGSSISRIKDNPYCIYTLGSIDFKQADSLAKRFGQCEWSDKRRLYSGVLAFLEYQAQNKGNSCLPLEYFLTNVNSFFLSTKQFLPDEVDKNGFLCSQGFSQDMLNDAIKYWNTRGKIIKLDVDGEEYLAKSDYYQIEVKSAKLLKKFIKERRKFSIDNKEIKDWLNSNDYPLSEEQEKALIMAVQNKCSILTGGPGTGKTYTTNAIVKILMHYYPKMSMLLLAPTGKAAARMKEITHMPAQTIHSVLKLKTEDIPIDDDFELDADFIIVDEVSMMDEKIFYLLLKHMKRNTALLMIGDANQLPSVGVGNVLADLLNSKVLPHTELNQIFRQGEGSDIVYNAHLIKNANAKDLENLCINRKNGDFEFVDKDSESAIADEIIRQIKKLIKAGHQMDNILCLSPIHATPIGTNELNMVLQSVFNPKAKNKPVYKINEIKEFRLGDRVIHLKNNALLGVKNGDLGTISDITKHCVSVDFDNKDTTVIYSKASLKELDLAYCLTVHKSQGSEAGYVIMPFSYSQFGMLNNKLIYTGITRAKKKFIGIGQLNVLKEGAMKKNKEKRYTLLKDFILVEYNNE